MSQSSLNRLFGINASTERAHVRVLLSMCSNTFAHVCQYMSCSKPLLVLIRTGHWRTGWHLLPWTEQQMWNFSLTKLMAKSIQTQKQNVIYFSLPILRWDGCIRFPFFSLLSLLFFIVFYISNMWIKFVLMFVYIIFPVFFSIFNFLILFYISLCIYVWHTKPFTQQLIMYTDKIIL